MILFVFEGAKAEPKVFESLGKYFLSNETFTCVSCKSDLPTLYSNLIDNDYDLFRVLPFEDCKIEIPKGKRLDTIFSQIFLFFDYDFQNRIGLEKVNQVLDEMLDYFDNETENGKLYINYPMVESLKYTKEMPDLNYCQYQVSRSICGNHKFKSLSEQFAYSKAKGFRFIDCSRMQEEDVISNWEKLKVQNVQKANFLVCGKKAMPNAKDLINQKAIFEAQIANYVSRYDSVSILNSFPIFIYEYFAV